MPVATIGPNMGRRAHGRVQRGVLASTRSTGAPVEVAAAGGRGVRSTVGWWRRWWGRGDRRLEEQRERIGRRAPVLVFEAVDDVDARIRRAMDEADLVDLSRLDERVREQLATTMCIDPAGWVRRAAPDLVSEYQLVVTSGHPDAAGHGVAWLWSLDPDLFRPLVADFLDEAVPLALGLARQDDDELGSAPDVSR